MYIPNGTILYCLLFQHHDTTNRFAVNYVCYICQDSRVAVKACEGIMLLCSIADPLCTNALLNATPLCCHLASTLCDLYRRLPPALSAVDIENTQAKWG